MAMAIQNLAWGIAQPLAGAIADRYGTAKVIVAGLLLYAARLALMVVSTSVPLLSLTGGIMVGVGIAMSSFSIDRPLFWYLGILLALASAAVHLPIHERSDASFRLRRAE